MSALPPSPTKLRIAITGGGLAGAAIATALIRQPHLDVHVYESAPVFSERGMAVNLSINAQRALAAIVPDGDAVALLRRAGAVPLHSARVMMGSGPRAGAYVTDIAEEHPPFTVHRASLLQELLAPLPKECMHTERKLVAVDRGDGVSLVLRFQDGSSANVDALIGADGIFGFVRGHVLGRDHPAARAVPAGWTATRNLVSFAAAEKKLGKEWFKVDRQFAWVGEKGFIMHDVLSDGELVQCIGACVDTALDKEQRKKSLTRAQMQQRFEAWMDGPIASGMVDLLMDQADPAAYAQWEFPDAPTYVKGQVCVAGDAAHAFTPWQGAGAGMALEDAVILSTLFGAVENSAQIEAVLKAYDAVRRPRTQRIAESSRKSGRILTGIEAGIGLDPDKMKQPIHDLWDYILNFDLEEHRRISLETLESILA